MHQSAPQWLALANTSLIVVSGAFLLVGYAFIRRGRVAWHHRSMITATDATPSAHRSVVFHRTSTSYGFQIDATST